MPIYFFNSIMVFSIKVSLSLFSFCVLLQLFLTDPSGSLTTFPARLLFLQPPSSLLTCSQFTQEIFSLSFSQEIHVCVLISNFTEFIDCRLVSLFSMSNSHIWLRIYHIYVYVSGIPHSASVLLVSSLAYIFHLVIAFTAEKSSNIYMTAFSSSILQLMGIKFA